MINMMVFTFSFCCSFGPASFNYNKATAAKVVKSQRNEIRRNRSMNELVKEMNGEVVNAAIAHTLAGPVTTRLVFVIVSFLFSERFFMLAAITTAANASHC